ncbi:Uncharacterised protein [uncultured archaeon]|nr:Uncharacterised protein [uncultured archaeon]
MNTVESPKVDFATERADSIIAMRSLLFLTTFMPMPPPPDDALTITGYPMLSAISRASSKSFMPFSLPGITGIPAAFMVFLASILLPTLSMAWLVGPMNVIPSFSQRAANSGFSARKP